MEVFGYVVGFFSFIIAILTGILGYLAWKNGQWMKLAHIDTQALIKETQALIKETQAIIKETQALIKNHHQDTLSLLEKMEKGQEEARKEMAEALKEIANLIVSEGKKTRKAIKV